MDIESIKADFEKGMTYNDIAEKHGISKGTVSKYKKKYDWKRAKQPKKKTTKKQKQNGNKSGNGNIKVSKKVSDMKLSEQPANDDKWKRFCLLYLKDYNATQSYLSVYDCSYSTAVVNGSKLLNNTKVQTYLNELRKSQSKDLYLDASDILKQQAKIAFADISKYLSVKTIKTVRKDPVSDEEVLDADGNRIIDVKNEIYIKDPETMDWSIVDELHTGKDGLVLKLSDRDKAIKSLLERLPEPQTSEKSDPIVREINKAIKSNENNLDVDVQE